MIGIVAAVVCTAAIGAGAAFAINRKNKVSLFPHSRQHQGLNDYCVSDCLIG